MGIFKKFFKQLSPIDDEGLFREIPLRCKGRLFVSPMPFGAYDPDNEVLKIYQKNKIEHVFVLATDDELKRKCRRKDLFKKYAAAGIQVSRYLLKDCQAPFLTVAEEMVAEATALLETRRVAVHCHAGVGRTGIAVCCIAMTVEGWSAETAMAHISQFMTINITDEQRRFIEKFDVGIQRTPT